MILLAALIVGMLAGPSVVNAADIIDDGGGSPAPPSQPLDEHERHPDPPPPPPEPEPERQEAPPPPEPEQQPDPQQQAADQAARDRDKENDERRDRQREEEEAQRQAQEQARIAEEQRLAAEQEAARLLAAEQESIRVQQAQEAARVAAEQEQQRRAAEEAQRQQQLAQEQEAQRQAQEQARIAAEQEQQRIAEQQRLAAERATTTAPPTTVLPDIATEKSLIDAATERATTTAEPTTTTQLTPDELLRLAGPNLREPVDDPTTSTQTTGPPLTPGEGPVQEPPPVPRRQDFVPTPPAQPPFRTPGPVTTTTAPQPQRPPAVAPAQVPVRPSQVTGGEPAREPREAPCAGARAATGQCEPPVRTLRPPVRQGGDDPDVNPADVRPPPDPEEVRAAQEAVEDATRNLEAARRRVERLTGDPDADPVELEIARQRVQESRAALDAPRRALELAQHPLTQNELLDEVQTRLTIGSVIPLVGPVFGAANGAVSARRAQRDLESGDPAGAALRAADLVPVDRLAGEAARRVAPGLGRLLGATAPEVGAAADAARTLTRAERFAAEAVDVADDTAVVVYRRSDGSIASTRTFLEVPEEVPAGFLPDGTISRETTSVVHCQGDAPTCGPVAAAMILTDLGVEKSPQQIVREAERLIPRGQAGAQEAEIVQLLRNNGVPARQVELQRDNLAQLFTATRDGPIIVRMGNPPGTPKFDHAIVVDGVTTINGEVVVAVRNSFGDGSAYFQLAGEFLKSYSGRVIIPRP